MEHFSLSIKPPPRKGNCEGGICNMNGIKNKFTATDLQANTIYTVSLQVENCAGYNTINQEVTTNVSENGE